MIVNGYNFKVSAVYTMQTTSVFLLFAMVFLMLYKYAIQYTFFFIHLSFHLFRFYINAFILSTLVIICLMVLPLGRAQHIAT